MICQTWIDSFVTQFSQIIVKTVKIFLCQKTIRSNLSTLGSTYYLQVTSCLKSTKQKRFYLFRMKLL